VLRWLDAFHRRVSLARPVFPFPPFFSFCSSPAHSLIATWRCHVANHDCIVNRADATIASQATGAMSWAFITALKKRPQQSYVQLLNSIRDELATKYSQKPQLSCSHPLSKDPGPQAANSRSFVLTYSFRHESPLRHVRQAG
jgi:hypothetical protein